jgi:hypothetical protein
MNSPRGMCLKLALFMMVVVGFSLSMRAQNTSNQDVAKPAVDPVVQRNIGDWAIGQQGVPDDWSHHHLVFSNPGTEQQAIESGKYEHWLKVVNSSRFTLQQIKRSAGVKAVEGADVSAASTPSAERSASAALSTGPFTFAPVSKGSKKTALKKDWAEGVGTGTINPNTYPAMWSFSTDSASCADDFIVYPTGVAGAGTHASIIGYYNIYSGCSGTVPEVDWAYNTGGTVSLSPAFSFEGNQVAFIQTSGSIASLVLLKFPLTPPGTGTLAAPITLSNQATAIAYTTCTAPCMWSVALSGNPSDTWSSPYYDSDSDTLFVGDSAGKLHKFAPVFNAALNEVTTAPWPVQLAHGGTIDTNQANGPVYDSTSGRVFVGTVNPGGYLYSVGSGYAGAASGTIYGYSAQLDTLYGIRDSVLVDSTAAQVYAFAGVDPSGKSGVYQFPTSFTSSTIPSEATTGVAGGVGVAAYQMSGTFDNTYYTSANPSSPTGYLYLCATGLGSSPNLYQVAITGDVMGTVKAELGLTNAALDGRCSPITEFYNANAVTTAPATAATGSVTIRTDPGTWAAGKTVTVGGTVYTFVASLTAGTGYQVLINSSGNTANRLSRTAINLEATINAVIGECYAGNNGPTCFEAAQTASNSYVTATVSGDTVTLTAKTTGTSSNFTVTTNYATGISVVPGTNGTNASITPEDLIFLSVLDGTQTGCTDDGNGVNGCVVSYNVTSPSSIVLSGIGLNITAGIAGNRSTPTGGLVIDNSVGSGTLAGASQVYFLTTDSTNGACTTGGTGICAVQAAQTSP